MKFDTPPKDVAPKVWIIDAYRSGEQSQIMALAEALGWPFEQKRLHYRPWAARVNLLRGSDLSGIDLKQSSPLQAPWPDLLITAGMRNEPVCRWIRDQSGGRCKIVHIGRPWANPECFDLVITTPQYRLPIRPNVVQNQLTLHRVTQARLDSEARQWQAGLAHLPRPYIAVIVGGNSGPYTFGPRAAQRLMDQAATMASRAGGSLLITTSARTPEAAVRVLASQQRVPVHFYPWRAQDPHNPYFGYLALADQLIVTADSISMLSEACATGKPVMMFDLGCGLSGMREDSQAEADAAQDFRLSGILYRGLMRWGWQRLSRDITLVHRALIESRRAVWLGEPPHPAHTPDQDDLDRAIQATRALFPR